jgi:hypothetical protein
MFSRKKSSNLSFADLTNNDMQLLYIWCQDHIFASYSILAENFQSLSQCIESRELRELLNTKNIDLVPGTLKTEIPMRDDHSSKEQTVSEKPTGRASVYMVGVEHEKYPKQLVWLSDIHFFGGQVSLLNEKKLMRGIHNMATIHCCVWLVRKHTNQKAGSNVLGPFPSR